jgi:hypothetical protein
MLLRFHLDDRNRLGTSLKQKSGLVYQCGKDAKREENKISAVQKTSKPDGITRQRTLKSSSQTA